MREEGRPRPISRIVSRIQALKNSSFSVFNASSSGRKAGAGKQFAGRFHDVGHQFTRTLQDEAFAWLDVYLDHRPR